MFSTLFQHIPVVRSMRFIIAEIIQTIETW